MSIEDTILEVVQAFKDKKPLEYRRAGSENSQWEAYGRVICPRDFDNFEFRIKREPREFILEGSEKSFPFVATITTHRINPGEQIRVREII